MRRHGRGDVYSDFEIWCKAGFSEWGQGVSHDLMVWACGHCKAKLLRQCSKRMFSPNYLKVLLLSGHNINSVLNQY